MKLNVEIQNLCSTMDHKYKQTWLIEETSLALTTNQPDLTTNQQDLTILGILTVTVLTTD